MVERRKRLAIGNGEVVGRFFERQRLAVSRRKIEPRRAGNNDPLTTDNSDGYRFISPFRGCAAQTMTSCGRLLPMVAVNCCRVDCEAYSRRQWLGQGRIM